MMNLQKLLVGTLGVKFSHLVHVFKRVLELGVHFMGHNLEKANSANIQGIKLLNNIPNRTFHRAKNVWKQ